MTIDLKSTIEKDPGNPLFVEYAEALKKEGDLVAAQSVCLKGLSYNVACHRGRLLLARLFYQQGYLPFAVREVAHLHQELPENEPIKKLLFKLAPEYDNSAGGASKQDMNIVAKPAEVAPLSTQIVPSVMAEADFDLGDLELLEEEK